MGNRSDQRKFHYLYKTICLVTGKWYVGIHSTDDMNDGYMGSGKRLWLSIKKYGKENHRLKILERDFADRKSLCLREAEVINQDFLNDSLCMNIILGGEKAAGRSGPHSEETKRKMSKSHKLWHEQNDVSFETRKKIGAAHRGKFVTPETGQKIAKILKGRVIPDDVKKKISEAGKGKHRQPKTDEQKEKISKSLSGIKHPNFGKKLSEETRRKISETHKRRVSSASSLYPMG